MENFVDHEIHCTFQKDCASLHDHSCVQVYKLFFFCSAHARQAFSHWVTFAAPTFFWKGTKTSTKDPIMNLKKYYQCLLCLLISVLNYTIKLHAEKSSAQHSVPSWLLLGAVALNTITRGPYNQLMCVEHDKWITNTSELFGDIPEGCLPISLFIPCPVSFCVISHPLNVLMKHKGVSAAHPDHFLLSPVSPFSGKKGITSWY
jgi:hypothetical protein